MPQKRVADFNDFNKHVRAHELKVEVVPIGVYVRPDRGDTWRKPRRFRAAQTRLPARVP
jgi:hypothetical protein